MSARRTRRDRTWTVNTLLESSLAPRAIEGLTVLQIERYFAHRGAAARNAARTARRLPRLRESRQHADAAVSRVRHVPPPGGEVGTAGDAPTRCATYPSHAPAALREPIQNLSARASHGSSFTTLTTYAQAIAGDDERMATRTAGLFGDQGFRTLQKGAGARCGSLTCALSPFEAHGARPRGGDRRDSVAVQPADRLLGRRPLRSRRRPELLRATP